MDPFYLYDQGAKNYNFKNLLEWNPYGEVLLKRIRMNCSTEIIDLYVQFSVALKELGGYKNINLAKEILNNTINFIFYNCKNNFNDFSALYNNYALILQDLGGDENKQEAIKNFEHALTISKDDLSRVIISLNLALLIRESRSIENLTKANFILQNGKKIVDEIFKEKDHRFKIIYYSDLSLSYKDIGKLDLAKQHIENAVKSSEKLLTMQHPTTTKCYTVLARIYVLIGDKFHLEEAKKYLLKVIEFNSKFYGDLHKENIHPYHNYGSVCLRLGDKEELLNSIIYSEKAIKIAELNYDKTHPELADLYTDLALAYFVTKKPKNLTKAKILLEKAEKIYGSLNERTLREANCLQTLSLVLTSLCEDNDHKTKVRITELFMRYTAIYVKILGVSDPKHITSKLKNMPGAF